MPPKGHRGAGAGLIRTHSRNSSATKLAQNLQLSTRDGSQAKFPEKTKKNGLAHDVSQVLGASYLIS